MGAALGGAEAAAVKLLVAIGERFGVSFQIIDDVTNLERGNPGKDRGDDLIEGKKSLPLILHRERSGSDELWGIMDGIQSRPIEQVRPQIDRAVALLQESGSLQDARRRATDLYRETRAELSALVPEGEPADRLLETADALIGAGGP
jgi:octaprenyl-diphosphate synthase